jgi:hypothetical protein
MVFAGVVAGEVGGGDVGDRLGIDAYYLPSSAIILCRLCRRHVGIQRSAVRWNVKELNLKHARICNFLVGPEQRCCAAPRKQPITVRANSELIIDSFHVFAFLQPGFFSLTPSTILKGGLNSSHQGIAHHDNGGIVRATRWTARSQEGVPAPLEDPMPLETVTPPNPSCVHDS